MRTVRNLIGADHVDATSGERIDDLGPDDGSIIATLPRSRAADVDDAVTVASAAQVAWAAMPLLERADHLDALADLMEEHIHEIAELEALDTGKPWEVALNVDASRSIRNMRFFASLGRTHEDPTFPMEDATNHLHRRPVGVVGLISPWNLPLYLLTWKVAPALLMGNTIIAKPSEMTPLTAHRFGELALEAGLPPGVLNLLHGYGPEVGAAIVEHPIIRGISFTGGTATGRLVAAAAAPMFKKLSLELGGKNATLLLDDVDLDASMDGIVRSGFLNSGQVCLCGSRILVPHALMEAFLERFIPAATSYTIGPLISEAHRAKVIGYLDLARSDGGTVHGGQPGERSGHHLQPAVITGLPPSHPCAMEEIFGPVVTVHGYEHVEEAIEIANGTEYGLAGSIWTGDTARGRTIAERLDTGMVWINTWLHRDLRVPFGGTKSSGVGREGGRWSLDFFSELTNICILDASDA